MEVKAQAEDRSTMTVMPDESNDAIETSAEATKQTQQQKIIKAGLLFVLVAIIVYVILDYTVSAHRLFLSSLLSLDLHC